ncbi:hypothetical protein RhoFasGS6_04916 [Rhodococcus fascians]|nr:hypothetical protein [Rhodococcus fascians]
MGTSTEHNRDLHGAHRLADILDRNLGGEFDDNLDLSPELTVRTNANPVVIDPSYGP